ncbi:MAG: hypothetical protein ACU0DK_10050 [Pseudooceanicola sp.]
MNNLHKIGDVQFQMLYPPEGNSSDLEVADSEFGPFLYVSLRKDGELSFDFLVDGALSVSEPQFREIEATARKNLAWSDLAASGLERFNES